MPIIGIARGDASLEALRARARESAANNGGIDEDALTNLAARPALVNGTCREC